MSVSPASLAPARQWGVAEIEALLARPFNDLVFEAQSVPRRHHDADAVQLVTVHRSKGLQYPIVYCPFAWDGFPLHENELERPRFHDRAAGDRLTLDVGSGAFETHRDLARREALAEHLRLLYVAVTRAKQRHDIVEHMSFAKKVFKEYGDRLVQVDPDDTTKIGCLKLFSGFMIVTHKEAWGKVGGFKNGFLGVDNEYCRSLKNNGYGLYTMPGLYMYHTYKLKGNWKTL